MSKAALDYLTRSLAGELAPAGVRVNGLALGPVDTPIHETWASDLDKAYEWLAGQVPLGPHRQGGGGGALDRDPDLARRGLGHRHGHARSTAARRWTSHDRARCTPRRAFRCPWQARHLAQSSGGGRHADPGARGAAADDARAASTLTIESQRGDELTTNSAAFDAFLAGMGKTRADFVLASAYARAAFRPRSAPGA